MNEELIGFCPTETSNTLVLYDMGSIDEDSNRVEDISTSGDSESIQLGSSNTGFP